MDTQGEMELEGGNLSKVVRVGETVRRTSGPWTPMVQRLLAHVRDRGFRLGPIPLGIDEQEREVLSYINGETLTTHPWPHWVWSDSLLTQAVDALVAYHRAVVDFRPAVVESRLGARQLLADEIVCHNDFAPYNSVFDEGNLIGIIDWDIVCPGRPSWDLAFFAWHWVPLHPEAPELAWRTVGECERRLRLVADAYGLETRTGFVEEIIERIDTSRVDIIERAQAGDPAFARLEREGHSSEMERTLAFVHSVENRLQSALEA